MKAFAAGQAGHSELDEARSEDVEDRRLLRSAERTNAVHTGGDAVLRQLLSQLPGPSQDAYGPPEQWEISDLDVGKVRLKIHCPFPRNSFEFEEFITACKAVLKKGGWETLETPVEAHLYYSTPSYTHAKLMENPTVNKTQLARQVGDQPDSHMFGNSFVPQYGNYDPNDQENRYQAYVNSDNRNKLHSSNDNHPGLKLLGLELTIAHELSHTVIGQEHAGSTRYLDAEAGALADSHVGNAYFSNIMRDGNVHEKIRQLHRYISGRPELGVDANDVATDCVMWHLAHAGQPYAKARAIGYTSRYRDIVYKW
ncbi:MAG: hypothetical protein SFX73_24125 [Kofleriaceae bacterium]|nr:hypothetical protein [Kofleriaceae bacterium]